MKGKICIDRYCTMESHKKKKAELKLNHWYTTQPGSTSVYVTPTLDAAIASNSSIWNMYEKGLHHAPAWDSIMSYVRSNAAASTVGAMLTEAASSAVMLGSFGDTNPIPKTPSLRVASKGDGSMTSAEGLASAVNTGFKRTDDSLADLYQEVVKLSARVGRPSDPSASHGSTYGDLEALQFYLAEVDSKCDDSAKSIVIHEQKFLLDDENFRKCLETLNQVVSASTAALSSASDAKNTVSALASTGAIGQMASLRNTIAVLEKTVAEQKAEMLGVYDLLEKVCGHLNQQPAAGTTNTSALASQVTSLEAEVKSLRGYVAEQLKTSASLSRATVL